MQHEDYRNAITGHRTDDGRRGPLAYGARPYSGAHVMHLAAFDRRVKCAVAQCRANATDNYPPPGARGQLGRAAGTAGCDRAENTPRQDQYLPVVAEQGKPSALPTQDSYDWFIKVGQTRAPKWENRQTVRSLELALEYNPAANIHLISPTPFMMIVAENDVLTPTDLAIEAFGRARDPKQLVILPGGHFDAYVSGFQGASTPALDWFKQHLMK